MKNIEKLNICLDFSENDINQLETLSNCISSLSNLKSLDLFLYENKTAEEGVILLTDTIV